MTVPDHNFRELPTWRGPRGGNGCSNPRCDTKTRFLRVLSIEEVEVVFPKKEKLSWWPLPESATHVCTSCGFAYNGVEDGWQQHHEETAPPSHEVALAEWDWDHDDQFDQTVREAVEEFVLGAPDSATADDVAVGVHRYIVGASAEFARNVMMDVDTDSDRTPVNLAEFM